jgi:DNA repair exonuclease SbcCD ATPase subunit
MPKVTPAIITLLRGGAFVAFLGALGAPAALAQPMKPGAAQAVASGNEAAVLMQRLQEKRDRLDELDEELMALQQQAIDANPGLASEREALQEYVEAGMKDAGYNVAEGRARVEELQSDLENASLSTSEQQESRQALRAELGEMREAQQQVMDGDEFKAKRNALNEGVLAAMEEQDPEVRTLLAELQRAQAEYQLMAQQIMQQQQGGAGAPPQ